MTKFEHLFLYWNVEKVKKSIENYQETISFWKDVLVAYDDELTEDDVTEIIRIIKSNESLIEKCEQDIETIIGEYHGKRGTPIDYPVNLIREEDPKKTAPKKAKTT